MNRWQPSETDRLLEIMRRLAGAKKSPRFPSVIRREDTATDNQSDDHQSNSGGCDRDTTPSAIHGQFLHGETAGND